MNLVKCEACEGSGRFEEQDETGIFNVQCEACEGAGYFLNGAPFWEEEDGPRGADFFNRNQLAETKPW